MVQEINNFYLSLLWFQWRKVQKWNLCGECARSHQSWTRRPTVARLLTLEHNFFIVGLRERSGDYKGCRCVQQGIRAKSRSFSSLSPRDQITIRPNYNSALLRKASSILLSVRAPVALFLCAFSTMHTPPQVKPSFSPSHLAQGHLEWESSTAWRQG